MTRPSTVAMLAASAVTVAGMVVTPLARTQGATRRTLSTVVVTGLFATTASRTAHRWGGRRAGAAAASIALATAAVERIGTRTGVPFGRYHYTGVLRPQVAGVPVIVPLAWFAMAVPARESAHAVLGERSSARRRVLLGSAALTAWDLFLDPQMVGEGYWRWTRRGAYRGIPASNYLGWFVTGVGVMAILDALLPVASSGAGSEQQPDPVLVGEYSFMAVMETVGFGMFFRDRVVAVVGGVAMLPIAALAALAVLHPELSAQLGGNRRLGQTVRWRGTGA